MVDGGVGAVEWLAALLAGLLVAVVGAVSFGPAARFPTPLGKRLG